MSDPSLTSFGEINAEAPAELQLFSFLVGRWTGTATTLGPEGGSVEYPMEWIGRYILDGMAIADEMRASSLPNNPVMGISFRSFDTRQGNWVIEFLNVAAYFLRKQVSRDHGEVRHEGNQVTILQSGPDGALVREIYEVQDENHFLYRLEISHDEGQSWGEAQVVIQMQKQLAGDSTADM